MYERNATGRKFTKFTIDELLSMFETEALQIFKKPDEAHSVAEETLIDFIKLHGQYVTLC